MSPLIEEFILLVTAFNRHKIEFALCGGLAVAAHGLVRATQDIDFLILNESLDAAYKAAAEVGYDIRGLDISFKERTVEIRRVSKVIGEDTFRSICCLSHPMWRTFGKVGRNWISWESSFSWSPVKD